jgi:opacity protein-like surface antigen
MAVWLCAGSAEGREYTFKADAGVGQDYHSNLFLTPLPHEELWSSNFGLNANYSAAEERWALIGDTHFQKFFYSDSSLDAENLSTNLTGTFVQNERTRWSLRGGYTRDATRTSLAEVNDLVFRQVGRERKSIGSSWARSLTEQASLNLDYQFQTTEYEQTGNNPFPDTEIQTGTAGLQYQSSERLKLNGVFSYTAYRTPGTRASTPFGPFLSVDTTSEDTRIDYASLMAGFRYAVDETLDVSLSGGGQYSMTESGSRQVLRDLFGNELPLNEQHLTSGVPSWLLSANLSKRFERSQLAFDFSKSSAPNIYGDLIEDTRYTWSGQYRFTPLLTGTARAVYSERGIGAADTAAILESVSVQTGMDWTLTPNWMVNVSYRYTRQAADTADEIPDNHALSLSIRYAWDKIQF